MSRHVSSKLVRHAHARDSDFTSSNYVVRSSKVACCTWTSRATVSQPCLALRTRVRASNHANIRTATRNCPFSLLGLWDKYTIYHTPHAISPGVFGNYQDLCLQLRSCRSSDIRDAAFSSGWRGQFSEVPTPLYFSFPPGLEAYRVGRFEIRGTYPTVGTLFPHIIFIICGTGAKICVDLTLLFS